MPARKSTGRKPHSDSANSERDAISFLKADHRRVRALLAELTKTRDDGASTREQLLATIEAELKVHTKIEEEVFYPALLESARKSDDRKLYHEGARNTASSTSSCPRSRTRIQAPISSRPRPRC